MDLSIEGLGGKGRKFGKRKVQIESDELPLLFFGSGIRFLFESSLRKIFGNLESNRSTDI